MATATKSVAAAAATATAAKSVAAAATTQHVVVSGKGGWLALAIWLSWVCRCGAVERLEVYECVGD